MKSPIATLTLSLLLTSGVMYSQADIPLTIEGKSTTAMKNMEQTTTAPGSKSHIIFNVNKPSLSIYKPEAVPSNGIGVLVIPGGAFHLLAYDDEGVSIAKSLAAKGYTAAVLKYRLVQLKPKNPFEQLAKNSGNVEVLEEIMAPVVPLAIEDGKTAMRYLKEHSDELGIDANKVGVIGFSAGGTIAAAIALDSNLRPLFSAPIYPYLEPVMNEDVPQTPTPIYMAVAEDDDFSFDLNSLKFYKKWKSASGLAEVHVYSKGGHGFASKEQGLPVDNWFDSFLNWLHFTVSSQSEK